MLFRSCSFYLFTVPHSSHIGYLSNHSPQLRQCVFFISSTSTSKLSTSLYCLIESSKLVFTSSSSPDAKPVIINLHFIDSSTSPSLQKCLKSPASFEPSPKLFLVSVLSHSCNHEHSCPCCKATSFLNDCS